MRLLILENRWKLYQKNPNQWIYKRINRIHGEILKIVFKCLSRLYKPIEKARTFCKRTINISYIYMITFFSSVPYLNILK